MRGAANERRQSDARAGAAGWDELVSTDQDNQRACDIWIARARRAISAPFVLVGLAARPHRT